MKVLNRFQPWMLVSAACIVPAGFAVFNRIAQTWFRSEGKFTTRDLIWAGGDWFVYAILPPFIFAVSRRHPIANPHLARRIVFHFGIAILFCVTWATCGKLLDGGLALVFEPEAAIRAIQSPDFVQKYGPEWLSWVFTTLPFGVIVYLCFVGAEHAFRYFSEAHQNEVQVARLSSQLADARFSALQAQVNPHFLFNTLNTIVVFVRDNDSRAVFIIEQLSELLRITLGSHHTNKVRLGEELELVRHYLNIEEARFSDRLKCEIDIPKELHFAMLPGFALQHLVENAIRHGIAKKTEAGELQIKAVRDDNVLELSVTDDGIGVEDGFTFPENGGLANTRERLRLLYGAATGLTVMRRGNLTIATLRIPYHVEAQN